jgi:acyl-CoA thioester hydrolase
MDGWHETEIRARYAETDQMGIVHHANFLIWFEIGRSEMCRARGFSYKQMEEEENALLVVAESYCRYKSPAFYEDVLTVRTKVMEARSRSLRFVYEVFRASDESLIAEGETLHVVTDRAKKVRSFPAAYRERLLADEEVMAFPSGQAPN